MNLKNLVLGIGIVIVFALVLWQGIETISPSPQWDEYCTERAIPQMPRLDEKPLDWTQETCEETGGQWKQGYCDFYAQCQQEFNDAQDRHARFAFYISLIVGILVIIIGYAILSVEPVGSSLIGSGIWAFFYGTVINWRNFANIWRFALLFLALILLIWLALRLNSNVQKKR